MKKYEVYPPGCCANPSDRWLCEVRQGGWIADWKRFDTEQEAQTWGKQHTGEMSKRAAGAIVSMVHRWANK